MPRRTTTPVTTVSHELGVAAGRLGAARRYQPGEDHSALEAEVARLAATETFQRLVQSAPPLTKAQKADLQRLIREAPSA